MISKEELNSIKSRKKTTLYYAEKEYLQHVFLHAISRFGNSFVFKGGTCLRICYGFGRASEDLDFSTSLGLSQVKARFNEALNDFKLLNIDFEVFAEKEFRGNIRFEARLKGPLYNGSNSSTNTLKIDFNKKKSKTTLAKVVPKVFSDIPPFAIVILGEQEILAEKIRALINRSQARDLYDVWMLLQSNIPINEKLLAEKLKEEKTSLSKLKIPSKEEYETGLKNLLNYLPDYSQVRKQVLERLEKTKLPKPKRLTQ
jgi:predicted nucleotidyltransferase component of viral defense system